MEPLAINKFLNREDITIVKVAGSNRPVGIFDSGVGGLSIAKAIAHQLPNEHLVYVADSLYSPYGEKPVDFIQARVNKISDILLSQQVKALVIACNTATVNAIDQLRERINLPIIGVEPAIKPAAQQSITKNVGILVTQATAENQRFKNLINQHKNDAQVHIQACPGLVELIEANQINSEACNILLKQFLTSLLAKNVDTLVLGCTHYPFLTEKIQNIVGSHMTLVESALPVSLQLTRKLNEQGLLNSSIEPSIHTFLSSNANAQQEKLFNSLWHSSLTLLPLQE